MMGIIVRNISSSGLSNIRVSLKDNIEYYPLDVFNSELNYVVPKVPGQLYTDFGIEYDYINETGFTEYIDKYCPVWYDQPNNKNYVKIATIGINKNYFNVVGGFNRVTITHQSSASTFIQPNSSVNITESTPAILDIQLVRKIKVTHLRLRNRNYTASPGANAPWRNYKLFGSNNKEIWTELFSVVNRSSSGGFTSLDDINNETEFRYYRFIITATYPHSTQGYTMTGMSEIDLLSPKKYI